MIRPHLTTPNLAVEFGLLRFRSPLLAKFLLVYIPPGTEMFYFPGCTSHHQVT